MMLMNTIIGAYWNWVDVPGLPPTVALMQPQLSLAWSDGNDFLRPLVQVQCEAFTSNETLTRRFVLPNDQLRGARDNIYREVSWDIRKSYTNLSTSDLLGYYSNLYWARLPLKTYEQGPLCWFDLRYTGRWTYQNEGALLSACSLVSKRAIGYSRRAIENP